MEQRPTPNNSQLALSKENTTGISHQPEQSELPCSLLHSSLSSPSMTCVRVCLALDTNFQLWKINRKTLSFVIYSSLTRARAHRARDPSRISRLPIYFSFQLLLYTCSFSYAILYRTTVVTTSLALQVRDIPDFYFYNISMQKCVCFFFRVYCNYC